MRVRATVQLQPDANGFAPGPGWEGDINPNDAGMQRLLNVGYLVPTEPIPMTAEQTAGIANSTPDETITPDAPPDEPSEPETAAEPEAKATTRKRTAKAENPAQ